jgi:hypothetical protein
VINIFYNTNRFNGFLLYAALDIRCLPKPASDILYLLDAAFGC